MNFCGRCDQPIRRGEAYIKRDIPGESLAGTTVYLHAALCRRKFTRTTQAS